MRAKTIAILAVVIFLLGGAIGALYAVLSAKTPSANEDLPVSSYDELNQENQENNDKTTNNDEDQNQTNEDEDKNNEVNNNEENENNNVTNSDNDTNEVVDHKVGEVNVKEDSALSLRKGPGTNYEKIGQVYRGDQLDILEEQNGWYKVQTYDGVEAWVSAEYVNVIE